MSGHRTCGVSENRAFSPRKIYPDQYLLYFGRRVVLRMSGTLSTSSVVMTWMMQRTGPWAVAMMRKRSKGVMTVEGGGGGGKMVR